ncbi:MAG: adenine phosphoribosyltransferase [Candidatus Omnitrophica bacterium]|nr:adenine phosphoribosyltransferase [Candidatus Omnitrophota bacterium]MCM8797867.1 adenine phosphoribosyltransferase [Candidatus Omnitrophota bacterium]
MGKDNFKRYIRSIPDFPRKGILFRDITTLLKRPKIFKKAVDILSHRYVGKKIDRVVSVEARGFIFGSVLAYKLNAGFVPVRKKGKLPAETLELTYSLEYGEDTLTIHKDALKKGERVLIVDDLLATGGTIKAVSELVERLGGKIIECVFLIELTSLRGRERLGKYPVFSLIKY